MNDPLDLLDVELLHSCETCGAEKLMTPRQAYEEGWDYPPYIGAYGVLSSRTCGNCPINTTLWWRVAIDKIDGSALTEKDLALLERIKGEPDSMRVEAP